MNFDNEEYYVNRELSWLEFNQRILNEAKDKTLPGTILRICKSLSAAVF